MISFLCAILIFLGCAYGFEGSNNLPPNTYTIIRYYDKHSLDVYAAIVHQGSSHEQDINDRIKFLESIDKVIIRVVHCTVQEGKLFSLVPYQ